MKPNNNVELSTPPTASKFDRSFLYLQSFAELEALAPLKQTDETKVNKISGPGLISAVRDLTTESGFQPYSEAEVDLENIKDFKKVKLTQTYLQEQRINNLIYLSMALREFGVDMFHLDGITTVSDENGKTVSKLSPPVIEVNQKGEYKLISGHQRFFTAYLLGTDIDVITIRNFDEEHARPYLPVDFEDISLGKSPPPVEDRRTLIPGHSETDFIGFESFGEDGKRRNPLESEKNFFPKDPTLANKKLVKEANRKLKENGAAGFFPSAVDNTPISTRESRIVTINNVTAVDEDYFLVDFDLSWKNSPEGTPPTKYDMLTETKEKSKNSANLVVITSEQYSNNTLPDHEVLISNDMRAQMNELLTANGLPPLVAKTNNPQFDLAAPIATGFELIKANSRFSILVVHIGAEKIAQVINHTDSYLNKPINGSNFIIRDGRNNLQMVSRFRESFGMEVLEFPRMYGMDSDRLAQETGINFDEGVDLQLQTEVPEARSLGINTLTLISGQLKSGYVPSLPNHDFNGLSKEISTKVIYTDTQIHALISSGLINCDFTSSTITIDQLQRGIVNVDPSKNPDNNFIVLEKYLSPLESKYFYRPPKVKNGTGTRHGHNSFPNDGCALVYEHTEVGEISSLPKDKCYQSFSITKVVEMMQSGELDTVAIANLSKVLRKQGYLVMSQ